MFADCSVRVRWPLDAADYADLFRGLAWGEIRDTKGLFGKTSGVETGSSKSRSRSVSAGMRVMMVSSLFMLPSPVAPQSANHRTRGDPPLRELDLQLPIRYRYASSFAYPNILPRRSIQIISMLHIALLHMHES
jgi:hypothetical protein